MEISIHGAIFKIGSMLPKLKTHVFSTGQIFSVLEHRISISGACSQNENECFSKRSRFLISGAHFQESMFPKMKYFFQFRKKLPISGASFTDSGAWIFLSFYLSIYLSIYLSYLSIYMYIYTYICNTYIYIHIL